MKQRHSSGSQGRWLLAFLVIIALAAGACSSSSSNKKASGPATDPNAILRMGLDFNREAPSFDPAEFRSASQPYITLVYDTMVRNTPQGLKPGLATAWKFPDTSTIVLTIREGVKFQDGTPLNPQAVKFSWDRLINTMATTKFTRVAGIKALKSVDVTGTNEVTVHLSSPLAGDWRDLLLFSPAHGLGIVSPTAVQKQGDGFAANPINAGAGPYMMVAHDAQHISVRKWDGYWDPSQQKLGGIDFIQVAPGAPTVTALAGGAVDLVQVAATDAKGLAAQNFAVEKLTPGLTINFWQLCTERAPFNNVAARRAVAEAINRDDIVSGPYQGYAQATPILAPLGDPGYTAAKALTDPNPYNPTKAKTDLAAAGVAPGTKLTISANTNPLNDAIMQVVQSQLKAVGIDLQIIPSTNNFADGPKVKADFESGGGSLGIFGAYVRPAPVGVANFCNYNNPEVASALGDILDVTKSAQYATSVANLQKLLYSDVPVLVFAQPYLLIAHSNKVLGVTGDPTYGNPEFYVSITMTK